MIARVPYAEWHNGHKDTVAISKVSKCKTGVNMWALVHKDDSVTIDLDRSECFYWINGQKRKDTRSVYVALRGDDADSWWWWNNLLNPTVSPWYESLLDIKVYEGDLGEYHVAHLGITDKTGLKDIVNLLIALRQASEHSGDVYHVKQIYDSLKDVTFSEALALSIMKVKVDDSGYQCDNEGCFMRGHSPLYIDAVPPRIAQRKPLKYTSTFTSTDHYGSDDDIWGAHTYYGYDPHGYGPKNTPDCDRKSWSKLIKSVPLVGAPAPITSSFALRIEEEQNANKVNKMHDISTEKMLTMLRTFELKDTASEDYVEDYEEEFDI